AQHPVILMGRASRDPEAWRRRVALAEHLGARVGTDIKAAASFPTDHPLHAIGPSTFLSAEHAKRLAEADVILSLDWVDLAGILRTAGPDGRPTARVIGLSPDQYSHGGWSMDYQGLPPAEVYMLCESDVAVPLLLDAVRARKPNAPVMPPALPRPSRPPASAL